MNIYPDFYNQFTCSGKHCLQTCCSGWNIYLDQTVWNYYNSLQDEFGQLVKKNCTYAEKEPYIKLTDQRRCPFLNEDGLCKIYIHYGEEHMSNTCRLFPRRHLIKGNNAIRCLSLSCERVLQILYRKAEPIFCHAEEVPDTFTADDLLFYELARFISWGVEQLQDTTIPFSICLATVLYVGMEAEAAFKNRDYESLESLILQASEILEQFQKSREELRNDSLTETAWSLIFSLTDTFCTIVQEANVYNKNLFLWKSELFTREDAKRKAYLMTCYEENRKTHKHEIFLRRLASVSFYSQSMALGAENGETLYLQNMCNYLILAEVLPPTWNLSPEDDIKQYTARLSHIARQFEQSDLVSKYVYPILRDLLRPDLYSYVAAFMVLFDDF